MTDSAAPTQNAAPPITWPVPTLVRRVVMVAGVLALITAAPLAVAAGLLPQIKPGESPQLVLMGFEIVNVVAAVILIGFGLGRYRSGPALALACLGGTILAGSGLGWLAANRNLAGHSLNPLLALRVLIAFLVLALAAWIVLSRDRRSPWLFAKGLMFCGAAMSLGGAFVYRPSRAAIQRVMELHTIAAFAIAIFGFFLGCVLIAVGGHLLIRAFELGRGTDAAPKQ